MARDIYIKPDDDAALRYAAEQQMALAKQGGPLEQLLGYASKIPGAVKAERKAEGKRGQLAQFDRMLGKSEVAPDTVQEALQLAQARGMYEKPDIERMKAELQQKVAQAREDMGKEGLEIRRKQLGIAGGDPVVNEQLAQALASGEMAPSQLSLLGPRAIARPWIISRAKQINPALDLTSAEQGFKTQLYEAGSQAQTRARVGESVMPLIEKLRSQITGSNLSDYPAVNKAKSAWQRGVSGGTEFTNLDDTAKLIADEIQSMVGVGSDVKLKLIQDIASPSQRGKKQALVGLKNIEDFVNARVKAFGSGGGSIGKAGPVGVMTKTQTNVQTGAKRTLISKDGGKTWLPQ